MKKFHLIFGAGVVIVFILTGQYMDRVLQHLHGMPDGPRMLYRSRHIYFLLSGLLHLALGTYWQDRFTKQRRALQMIGSFAITVSSVLFLFGFFKEPSMANLYVPFSRPGIFLIAGGTLLHVLATINEGSK